MEPNLTFEARGEHFEAELGEQILGRLEITDVIAAPAHPLESEKIPNPSTLGSEIEGQIRLICAESGPSGWAH
jgi:hypothetical protein